MGLQMTYDDLIAVSAEVVPIVHVEAPCWWTWERMLEQTAVDGFWLSGEFMSSSCYYPETWRLN